MNCRLRTTAEHHAEHEVLLLLSPSLEAVVHKHTTNISEVPVFSNSLHCLLVPVDVLIFLSKVISISAAFSGW